MSTVDTLVFVMGTKTLHEIVENLIAGGRSPDTPIAVIQWGTTPEQRTVTGTLADIAQRVEDAGLTPPAVTVVGEVVRLRETLSWFAESGGRLAEDRPLFGKRVLITRTRSQASTLARLLAEEGAIPIELPAIEIEPTADPTAVASAIEDLQAGRYAWAVFTSANAVDLWFGHLRDRNVDARAFGAATRPGGPTLVAAIGPATADALAAHGITADVVPGEYIAEALTSVILSADSLLSQNNASPRRNPAAGWKGPTPESSFPRILLPRAESARPELVEGLRALGAQVDEVTLYRAAVPETAPAEALSLLREGAIDIVTFTSSSTVRNLAAMLNGDLSKLIGTSPLSRASGDGPGVRDRPLITCIGPITAKTAEELGLRVDVVAEEYTVEGLVRAIRERMVDHGAR